MNLMIIVQIYIFGAKLCDHKRLDDGDVMVIGEGDGNNCDAYNSNAGNCDGDDIA